jgi:hypothetical protein
MSEQSRRSWTGAEVVAGIIVATLLALVMVSLKVRADSNPSLQASKAMANCRQIIIALRLYAADHDGVYPDSVMTGVTSSNAVFRHLMRMGAVTDETIFGGGARSPFNPDGKVGRPPMYPAAVQPGENHWAMTKGLTDSSPFGLPLVFENPSVAQWPPKWNADADGKKVKGRPSVGSKKLIIGTNDASVELMVLEAARGEKVPLKSIGEDGLDLFTQYQPAGGGSGYRVLDIEVKK